MHRVSTLCVARTPRGGDLPLYARLCSHSEGFEWGYSGGGPAQLAFALLYHCTRDPLVAAPLFPRFMHAIVSPQKRNEWGISPAFLRRWVESARADSTPAAPIWSAPDWALNPFLTGLSDLDRETIRQLMIDRAVNPLADLLMDAGWADCPLVCAALLIEHKEEGRVAV